MSLRNRFPAAFAAAFLVAGFAPAAEPGVIVQSQSFGETLGLVRGLAERYGGSKMLQEFNDEITKKLGEKGFTGLDQTRPLHGYMVQTDDPQQPGGVVLIPISTEKEFKDLLKRLGGELAPLKDAEGLYEVVPPEGTDANGKSVRLRFVGTYAYVGFNLPDAELAADKLVAPEKLVVPGPSSLLTMRTYFQRFPKDAYAQNKEQMQQVKDVLDGLPLPEDLKGNVIKLIDTSMEFSARMAKEGDIYDLRVDVDGATDDLKFDVVVKPLPGTALEKQITAYTGPTNRFASMMAKDAIFGVVTRLPLFTPEIRGTVSDGIKLLAESQEAQIPEPAKAIADEAIAGVMRTVKSGAFDFGSAIYGPNKDGRYSIALGVSFVDPAAVEKEMRELLKTAPEGVENFVKLDAEKADGVGIHVVTAGGFLPPEPQEMFGEKSVLAFAFAPKAILVAFGEDAVARVKVAIAAKPQPSPVAHVVTDGPALMKFAEKSGQPIDPQAKAMFDKDGGQKTAFRMDIAGGKVMTVTTRLRLAPFFLAGFGGVGSVSKPEPINP